MHRIRSGIVGTILVAALAGCGDSGPQGGPGGFTSTDTKPLDPMIKQMQDTMKKKDYAQKAAPPVEKEKKESAKKK